MQALAELKNDIQKLKAEESLGPAGGGDDDVTTGVMQGYADRPLVQVPCSDSTAGISGFTSNSAVQYLSSDNSDSQEKMHGSVLMQCARAISPLDEVYAEIDRKVVKPHVCNGSQVEEYEEILAMIRPRDPAAVMHWLQWNVIHKFKMR